ncbi:MAG: hypothetical protein CMM81_08490 [Rhodospirillales bacterium]|jgi:hypothetical protein|uniref:DarT1-associated NADAR antitoxin family protein n=1 Tax=Hwanghaeella sp. 1Z406 TaxID=3402811 RepID=UPI000C90C071|nr:hypothetical protein [Rhodospirillales bacterium]|tara:strand:- start:2322 stop:3044 length:723 start_codon:yes stop_codon:yes gene_type:complete
MANRPIYLPNINNDTLTKNDLLVKKIWINFDWNPGFSQKQKEKNIKFLHDEAKNKGISPILEISTKSSSETGKKLSAFSLNIHNATISIESAFQGSKVFENGGPYQDLYNVSSRDAKKDQRIKSSGNIIGFKYFDKEFSNEPKTAFYTWLYINALHDYTSFIRKVYSYYRAFSDIEFNPEKSLNCQAEAFCIFASLDYRNELKNACRSYSYLQELMRQSENCAQKNDIVSKDYNLEPNLI